MRLNGVLTLLLALVLVEIAWAGFRCHKNCNGHGRCSNDDVCHCDADWDSGVVPDCSQRVCRKGYTWADKPYGLDTAHSKSECSGAGLCNRRLGACECFDGFTGVGCERLKCEDRCNGNGVCMTMTEMYRLYNPLRDTDATYSNWDGSQVMGCVCDTGFTGGRCESRMCPKGNDPISSHNGYHKIVLRTYAAAGTIAGALKFTFNDKSFFFPAQSNLWSDDDCATSFRQLPNIKTVSCTRNGTDYTDGGRAFFIELEEFPASPFENNIYSHNGRPHLDSFWCDNSLATLDGNHDGGVHCNVFEAVLDVAVTVPSYEYCSNRGVCDFNSGDCQCFKNFVGGNCGTYMPDDISRDIVDVLRITNRNDIFNKTVLHVADTVYATDKSRWKSLVFEINNHTSDSGRDTVFNISANGDVDLRQGGFSLSGPHAAGDVGKVMIQTSGVKVTGGVSVHSGGLWLLQDEEMRRTPMNNTPIVGAMTVKGGFTTTKTVYIDSKERYNLGLTVHGGMTIKDIGMVVPNCYFNLPDISLSNAGTPGCWDPRGVYVGAGGLTVSGGGIRVYGRMNVTGGLKMAEHYTRGVTISTGGLNIVSGGMTVNAKGMSIDRASTISSGGLTVVGGLTASWPGLSVPNGVTVSAGGLDVTGILITRHGLNVTAGGASVQAGGMWIANGGANVNTAGARVHLGGATIKSGGVQVGDTGMVVTLTGMKVATEGIKISGGTTITNTGLNVWQSPILVNGGMHITGGLRHELMHYDRGAASSHIRVKAGGILVPDVGVDISDGFRILSGGLSTATTSPSPSEKGLAVTSGLGVTGGMTISNTGVTVTAGGSTVKGGMSVSGGIAVPTGGGTSISGVNVMTGRTVVSLAGIDVLAKGIVVVSGGLTVVANGMTVHSTVDRGKGWDAAHYIATSNADIDGGIVVTQDEARVYNQGLVVDGGASIGSGGFTIQVASKAVSSVGQLSVYDGLTIAGGGHITGITQPYTVNSKVTNGAVVSGGVKVYHANSATKEGGVLVKLGGMVVSTGGATFSRHGGPVYNNPPCRVHTAGLFVTGGLTVGSAGLYSRDGVTITDDGLTVSSLQINAGGLVAAAGIIVQNPTTSTVHFDATVDSGMTVHDVGVTITNDGNTQKPGLLVGKDGLKVTQNSIVVTDGGLTVDKVKVVLGGTLADAITVQSGGISTFHQFQVGSVGLTVGEYTPSMPFLKDASFRVNQGGLRVTGGLSINTAGLNLLVGNLASPDDSNGVMITGGLTVTAGGLSVADGLKIADEFQRHPHPHDNSLTNIPDDGMMAETVVVSSDGVRSGNFSRVENHGITITLGGGTVTAGGLSVGVNRTLEFASAHGVTIGSASPNSGTLVVANDLTVYHGSFSYSGTLNVVSDKRLKTNVAYMSSTEAMTAVRSMQGVYFHWNETHAHSSRIRNASVHEQGRKVGFIAQDIQKVVPEVVTHMNINIEGVEEKSYLGVAYTDLVPFIVEAVKDLSQRLATKVSAIPSASTFPTTPRERVYQAIDLLETSVKAAESYAVLRSKKYIDSVI